MSRNCFFFYLSVMWNRQDNLARLFQLEFSLGLYVFYKVICDYKKKHTLEYTLYSKKNTKQDRK